MGTKGQGLDKGRKVLTLAGHYGSLRGWSLHARAPQNFWKLVAKSKHQVRLTT
jgi:hypothetical protein